MTRPDRARLGALLLVAALLAVACGGEQASPSASATVPPTSAPSASTAPDPSGSTPPSSQPTGQSDALYDQIEDQVLAIRGLDPVDVDRQTIDGEALKAYNAENFDEDNPAAYVAATERLYKALGLMPEDQSLKQLFLDLIDSQVAGFYDPDAKQLFVVSRSGAINGADKITFAHEYDHALQDANFDVFGQQKELLDQSDRALARAALYEGDATLLMSYWAQQHMTADELAEVAAAGNDPEAQAVLARTPSILVDTLLFPYTIGQAFVLPIQLQGDWAAIDAIYDDLPESTEQVLHPDKYASGEAPVAVELPDVAGALGTGWSKALEDTFGEFQLRTWLREAGVPTNTATAAAEGWGGDRLAVLAGPNEGWAVVLRSVWDGAEDASEFQAAAGQAVADGPGEATVIVRGGVISVLVASDAATLEAVVGAAGS